MSEQLSRIIGESSTDQVQLEVPYSLKYIGQAENTQEGSQQGSTEAGAREPTEHSNWLVVGDFPERLIEGSTLFKALLLLMASLVNNYLN